MFSGSLNRCKDLVEARAVLREFQRACSEKVKAEQSTPNCSVVVKNLLENLRSALDYLAHEAHDRHGAKVSGKKTNIYFPISPRGDPFPTRHKSFAEWVNKDRIPGLNDTRPDIVNLLESFQEHKDPSKNGWLPDFATLCNGAKHADLDPSTEIAVPCISIGGVLALGPGALVRNTTINGFRIHHLGIGPLGQIYCQSDAGIFVRDADGYCEGDPGTLIKLFHESATFDAVHRRVLPFLDEAVAGTERIVEAMIKTT
jgi:hypothetical protein